jgi:hypothetical protein
MKTQKTQQKIKTELTSIFSKVSKVQKIPEINVGKIENRCYVRIETKEIVKTNHAESSEITILGNTLEDVMKLCKKYKLEINSISNRTWTWESTSLWNKEYKKETELTTKILLVERD